MTALRSRLGLGSVPTSLEGRAVVVRQFGAIVTGVFLITMLTLMGAAILANPTATVEGGDSFGDRLYFGMLVVPGWWAVRRFFLRPRIEITDDLLVLHNAFSSARLRWPEVSDAALTSGIEVRVSGGGDPQRSMVFGPALSTPFTRDSRAAAVVELIRSTAAARGGSRRDPDDAYQADDLVAATVGNSPVTGITSAITHCRTSFGWAELGAYALLWAVLSLVTSALS